MEIDECLLHFSSELEELLGSDYNKKPVNVLHTRVKRKARLIVTDLKPFARKFTFPETYNPRAIHSLFALAFLYYSPFFTDFIRVVRLKTKPKTSTLSPSDFVAYVLETVRGYRSVGTYKDTTVRLYSDMSEEFRKVHAASGPADIIGSQLVVVVDFTNPVDQIKRDIELLLNRVNKTLDEIFVDLVTEANYGVLPKDWNAFLPSKVAAPVKDELNNAEKYLPQWYQSLLVHRMKLLKRDEKCRIGRLCRISKGSIDEGDPNTGYGSGKTTVHNRLKLSERLILSAYYRKPLTSSHTTVAQTGR